MNLNVVGAYMLHSLSIYCPCLLHDCVCSLQNGANSDIGEKLKKTIIIDSTSIKYTQNGSSLYNWSQIKNSNLSEHSVTV